jgi:hypothetical protein
MHWVSINTQTPDPLKDIYTIALMRCMRIYSLYKSIICAKIYLPQGIIRVLICRLTSDPQDGPHTTDRPRKPRTPHTLWADSARDVSDGFFLSSRNQKTRHCYNNVLFIIGMLKGKRDMVFLTIALYPRIWIRIKSFFIMTNFGFFLAYLESVPRFFNYLWGLYMVNISTMWDGTLYQSRKRTKYN